MDSTDTLATMARLGGGLIVVLVLMLISAKLARRVRGQTGDSGLVVVDRIGLSRDAHLAVVRAGERTLLLGVTSQGVSMLSRLDGDEVTLETALEDPVVRAATVEIVQDGEEADVADLVRDFATVEDDDTPPPRPAPRARLPKPNAEFEELAAMAELIERTASMDQVVHAPSSHHEDDAPAVPAPRPAPASTPRPAPRSAAGSESRSATGSAAGSAAEPAGPGLGDLDLDAFPDLASALRAAGRTVGEDAETTVKTPRTGRRLRTVPNEPPKTRAEARAREREAEENRLLAEAREQAAAEAQAVAEARALAQAHVKAQEKAQAAQLAALLKAADAGDTVPATPATPATGAIPAAGAEPRREAGSRPADAPEGGAAAKNPPAKKPTAVVPRQRQASGSVLNPATWRQGIEALREMTVRRG